MKKNAILTSVIATCCALSLNTGTDAMGFEDDLGHANFVLGGKTLDNKLKVSNPIKEQAAIGDTTVTGLVADDLAPISVIKDTVYTSTDNVLGQEVELDLASQTQVGLDFDVKVDNYLAPFNLAFGYFKSSGQLVDDTFTQTLKSAEVTSAADKFTTAIATSGAMNALDSTATLKPEARSQSSELRFGARKYKDFANGISIFYGLGIASIDYAVEGKYVKNGTQHVVSVVPDTLAVVRQAQNAELVSFSQSASTLGFYGEIATLYKLADNFHLGAKLDMSAGSVSLENQATGEDEDIQVGGMNYSLFAGVSF